MTPEDLARTHVLCFQTPRPWSAKEFQQLLSGPGVFLTGDSTAFAMGREVAGECELLTLAVRPEARRQGLGQAALMAYEAEAKRRGASASFLEVAADNRPAIALYSGFGYVESGRRPGYYRHKSGKFCDALVLSKPLLPD